jgi:hypothetical protein
VREGENARAPQQNARAPQQEADGGGALIWLWPIAEMLGEGVAHGDAMEGGCHALGGGGGGWLGKGVRAMIERLICEKIRELAAVQIAGTKVLDFIGTQVLDYWYKSTNTLVLHKYLL